MPLTTSPRLPADCSPVSHARLWSRWIAAPLLLFVAATAGCQKDRHSNSNRLPPEKELQRLDDETSQTTGDPRRPGQEELEARDGLKALKDVEANGVKIKE